MRRIWGAEKLRNLIDQGCKISAVLFELEKPFGPAAYVTFVCPSGADEYVRSVGEEAWEIMGIIYNLRTQKEGI